MENKYYKPNESLRLYDISIDPGYADGERSWKFACTWEDKDDDGLLKLYDRQHSMVLKLYDLKCLYEILDPNDVTIARMYVSDLLSYRINDNLYISVSYRGYYNNIEAKERLVFLNGTMTGPHRGQYVKFAYDSKHEIRGYIHEFCLSNNFSLKG